ncbi:HAAS signaling domain-containing protein [Bacillus sp. S14(2024)]|uniref:HAAS signaling domain-containing protein n=1 Tax=Bacillus sp. S14(2024) TaxID=3162884 RepID=UPI003D20DB6A
MTKEQFLHELSEHLRRLPEEERNDILYDYEEHFQFGIEEGKTETEIIKALGSPKTIAKETLASHRLEQVKHNPTFSNVTRAIVAIIGLSFLNLVIMLAPLLTIGSLIFALWMVSTVFVLSPLLLLTKIIFAQIFILSDVFASIILFGIGLLLGIGAYYCTIWFKTLFVKYANWNLKVIKGE